MNLKASLPKHRLRRGDVPAIVEHHPVSRPGTGLYARVFNAVGDTVAVVTMRESQIEPLTAKKPLACATSRANPCDWKPGSKQFVILIPLIPLASAARVGFAQSRRL
jgi:hypothetical protein